MGGDPVMIAWPKDSLGWFTDQACNLIRLADDEARMMSHATVEPEHLLTLPLVAETQSVSSGSLLTRFTIRSC